MKLSKTSLLWAATDTGGTTVLTLVTMLLMARMMTPEQFGTGALVIGSVQFLNLFVGGFLHDGLIQNSRTDDVIFDTAFTLVLLIAISIVVAVVVAVATHEAFWASTGWLFAAASLVLPFSGALGIASARMRRNLTFRELAQASLTGRLVGCVTGLLMARAGDGACSLIGQLGSDCIVNTLLLYALSGWRPKLRASFRIIWPICRFALPNAFMHSLVAVRIQGFLMMVAGFAGLSAAGYMNVAFRLTTTPQIVLATAFTNLGLPLLARDQDSGPAMERSFLVVTQLVMSITIPAFIGLAMSATELVPILLGTAWVTVTPMVQLLALGAAISFLRFPASAMLRALGHVRYSFASSFFQLVVTLFGMAVLRPDNLQVIAGLWVLPTLLQLPATLLVASRKSMIHWQIVIMSLLPVVTASAFMVGVMLIVADLLQGEAPVYRLIGKVASGALVVSIALLLGDRRSRLAMTDVLRRAMTYRFT